MNKKNPPREPGGDCVNSNIENEKLPGDRALKTKIGFISHFYNIF
jgi:hypothetical protein